MWCYNDESETWFKKLDSIESLGITYLKNRSSRRRFWQLFGGWRRLTDRQSHGTKRTKKKILLKKRLLSHVGPESPVVLLLIKGQMWHWYEQYNLVNIILNMPFLYEKKKKPFNRSRQKNQNRRTESEPNWSNQNLQISKQFLHIPNNYIWNNRTKSKPYRI